MNVLSTVSYERTHQGVDVYVVPTEDVDFVTSLFAFPGGTSATYEKQVLSLLLSDILPVHTRKKQRSKVLERFDDLGADVSIYTGKSHLIVKLMARKHVFTESLTLLGEVLSQPRFTEQHLHEAATRIATHLANENEDTSACARQALTDALYLPGHPHWHPSPQVLSKELRTLTCDDVRDYHRRTTTTLGSYAVVAGAVEPRSLFGHLVSLFENFPRVEQPSIVGTDVTKQKKGSQGDYVVSRADKMNIDTYLALPLRITRESADFEALAMGVQILGGSATSRLFNTLRTNKSLTYGSYASLVHFDEGYPGVLRAKAIFPSDVFIKGRTALRDVVREFVEKGITASELRARKTEIVGRYHVGLATTRSLAESLFTTLLWNRPPEYLTTYPEHVEGLQLKDVNAAIRNNLVYADAVTAASGSINNDGSPLS